MRSAVHSFLSTKVSNKDETVVQTEWKRFSICARAYAVLFMAAQSRARKTKQQKTRNKNKNTAWKPVWHLNSYAHCVCVLLLDVAAALAATVTANAAVWYFYKHSGNYLLRINIVYMLSRHLRREKILFKRSNSGSYGIHSIAAATATNAQTKCITILALSHSRSQNMKNKRIRDPTSFRLHCFFFVKFKFRFNLIQISSFYFHGNAILSSHLNIGWKCFEKSPNKMQISFPFFL